MSVCTCICMLTSAQLGKAVVQSPEIHWWSVPNPGNTQKFTLIIYQIAQNCLRKAKLRFVVALEQEGEGGNLRNLTRCRDSTRFMPTD